MLTTTTYQYKPQGQGKQASRLDMVCNNIIL